MIGELARSEDAESVDGQFRLRNPTLDHQRIEHAAAQPAAANQPVAEVRLRNATLAGKPARGDLPGRDPRPDRQPHALGLPHKAASHLLLPAAFFTGFLPAATSAAFFAKPLGITPFFGLAMTQV